MNDKILKMFCSGILISDVISYIDAHPKEYEQFVKEEQSEQKEERKNVLCKSKQHEKTENGIKTRVLL